MAQAAASYLLLALAALSSLASLILSALVINSYLSQESYIQTLSAKAVETNTPLFAAQGYNIFACASIFVIAPLCMVLVGRRSGAMARLALGTGTLLGLTAALTLTVIVARDEGSYGDSVGPRVTIYLDENLSADSPRTYRDNHRALAGVVLVWVATLCCALGMIVRGGKREKQRTPIEDEEVWEEKRAGSEEKGKRSLGSEEGQSLKSDGGNMEFEGEEKPSVDIPAATAAEKKI